MNWRNDILAERASGELLVLDEGVPLKLRVPGLFESDASAKLLVHLRVVAGDSAADRAIIAELLGPDARLTSHALARRLVDLSRGKLREAVRGHDVAAAPDAGRIASVRAAIAGAGFASGFHVTDPFTVEIERPTAAVPVVAPRVDASARLAVLAGDDVLLLTPASREEAVRHAVPAAIGATRSLRSTRLDGRDVLLVAGREGVAIIDLVSGESLQTLALDAPLASGFNATLLVDGALLGTHGTAGVWQWRLAGAGGATPLHAAAARHLCAAGDDVVFASSRTLLRLEADGTVTTLLEASAEIVGAWPESSTGARVSVAGLDGTLFSVDVLTGRVETVARLGPVQSAAGDGATTALVRPSGQVEWLGVEATAPSVPLRGFTGARSVSTAVGWVVATAERLDKVAVWRCDAPHDTVAVLEVSRLAGHRVADAIVIGDAPA